MPRRRLEHGHRYLAIIYNYRCSERRARDPCSVRKLLFLSAFDGKRYWTVLIGRILGLKRETAMNFKAVSAGVAANAVMLWAFAVSAVAQEYVEPVYQSTYDRYAEKRLNYGNEQWDLYVFDTYTGTETRLTGTVQRENEPKFSPDGQTIAFYANLPGVRESYDIYIIRLDGSEFRNVTNTPDVSEGGPAWSPEGKRIAFVATPEDAEGAQVYILNLATGETTRITDSAGGIYAQPAFSPDGWTLAMANRRNGVNEIVLHDLRTGEERPLSHNNSEGLYPGNPTWSPDGEKIAYTLSMDRSTHLYVVDIQDGRPVEVATEIRHSRGPVWGPDSRTVTFAGRSQLMSIAVDGSARLPIPALPESIADSNFVANSFDRSRDGRMFAYVEPRYDPRARAASGVVLYDDGEKIDVEMGVELNDLPPYAYATKGEDGQWVYREITSAEYNAVLEELRAGAAEAAQR